MENFEIHKIPYSDIKKEYPDLFKEIFEVLDKKQLPSYIYTGYLKGDYVGFMSGFLHNAEIIYLQYAGFNDKYKGYYAPVLFREVVEFVLQDFKHILIKIINTHTRAIKVALNAGFIITGFSHTDTSYVEMLRSRK